MEIVTPKGQRKGLIIIFDGLGDRPNLELENQTPLAAASTPNLDRLVRKGCCGQVDPLAAGQVVETHVGSGILMGVPPADIRRLQRGPVEAASVGLEVNADDVLVRCNFATLAEHDGRLVVIDRRAGRINVSATPLPGLLEEVDLGEGITACLRPTSQHRAVLRLRDGTRRDGGLSPAIGDTDPGDEGMLPAPVHPCVPHAWSSPAARRTADAMNRFMDKAHHLLAAHPYNAARAADGLPVANGIICRSAGMVLPPRNLIVAHGIRAAVVSAKGTVSGLGRMFGFTIHTDPRFTALPDTDLALKVAMAKAALEHHDLVYLHFKGTDICAHDRQPLAKRDFIERADQALGTLLDPELVIAVSADHCTNSRDGLHCADPVPALLYVPEKKGDTCTAYSEARSARGGLGRLTGHAFLKQVLWHMGFDTPGRVVGRTSSS